MASYNSFFWNGPAFPYSTPPGSQAQTESQETDEPSETNHLNMEVKLLNTQNKREYRLYTLRDVSSDLIDSPEKLKKELMQQCGWSSNIEVGYFHHAKKKWINNRLDVNDMWKLVAKGDKVILWCVENNENSRATSKRPREDSEESEPPSKKTNNATEKVREIEVELKKIHGTAYSNFQFKLWAEMYSNGNHSSMDEPPAVAMFNRETPKRSHGQADVIVSVIDKLCTALTPKVEENRPSSLVNKAELRSTYIKQLNELKTLFDNDILTETEYTEQRDELVELMRQLKN